MKKILIMLLVAAMAVFMGACGSSEDEVGEEELVTGGWTIADQEEAALPEEVKGVYETFVNENGSELVPIAYIAKQVVAGMNYELICKDEENGTLQSVCLYQDPQGDLSDTIINEFDVTDYVDSGDTESDEATAEPVAGGWEGPEDYTVVPLPKDAQKAFEKAVAEFDGNELEPMALLATQLVSGTNYAILCHSTLVTAEPVTAVDVVTVYEDLDGNAEITNICTLDPAELNEE